MHNGRLAALIERRRQSPYNDRRFIIFWCTMAHIDTRDEV